MEFEINLHATYHPVCDYDRLAYLRDHQTPVKPRAKSITLVGSGTDAVELVIGTNSSN